MEAALAVKPENRPQSIAEFVELFGWNEAAAPLPLDAPAPVTAAPAPAPPATAPSLATDFVKDAAADTAAVAGQRCARSRCAVRCPDAIDAKWLAAAAIGDDRTVRVAAAPPDHRQWSAVITDAAAYEPAGPAADVVCG